jgi:hypothetical protein
MALACLAALPAASEPPTVMARFSTVQRLGDAGSTLRTQRPGAELIAALTKEMAGRGFALVDRGETRNGVEAYVFRGTRSSATVVTATPSDLGSSTFDFGSVFYAIVRPIPRGVNPATRWRSATIEPVGTQVRHDLEIAPGCRSCGERALRSYRRLEEWVPMPVRLLIAAAAVVTAVVGVIRPSLGLVAGGLGVFVLAMTVHRLGVRWWGGTRCAACGHTEMYR